MIAPLLFAKVCNLISTRLKLDTLADNLREKQLNHAKSLILVPENTLLYVDYRGSRKMVIARQLKLDNGLACTGCRYTYPGDHLFILTSEHEPEIIGNLDKFVSHPVNHRIYNAMRDNSLLHSCDLVVARTIENLVMHHKASSDGRLIRKVMREIIELDRFAVAAQQWGI